MGPWCRGPTACFRSHRHQLCSTVHLCSQEARREGQPHRPRWHALGTPREVTGETSGRRGGCRSPGENSLLTLPRTIRPKFLTKKDKKGHDATALNQGTPPERHGCAEGLGVIPTTPWRAGRAGLHPATALVIAVQQSVRPAGLAGEAGSQTGVTDGARQSLVAWDKRKGVC